MELNEYSPDELRDLYAAVFLVHCLVKDTQRVGQTNNLEKWLERISDAGVDSTFEQNRLQ